MVPAYLGLAALACLGVAAIVRSLLPEALLRLLGWFAYIATTVLALGLAAFAIWAGTGVRPGQEGWFLLIGLYLLAAWIIYALGAFLRRYMAG